MEASVDDSSYTIVHKILDSNPDYNLLLLRRDDQYRVSYGHSTDLPVRFKRWYDIDELARWGVGYLSLPPSYCMFMEMGEFIREYVGEARWILAVLEQT
jgi:hypothetical protein